MPRKPVSRERLRRPDVEREVVSVTQRLGVENTILADLCLHCCTQTSFVCGEPGRLRSCSTRASHFCGFSCCTARGLQQLWHTGLVALQHVESSCSRGGTRVPCIDRPLNHWTTRKVWGTDFLRALSPGRELENRKLGNPGLFVHSLNTYI